MGLPVHKSDFVRVEQLIAPESRDKNEGLYEIRTTRPDDRGITMDVLDLLKEFESYPVLKGKSEQLLDRIYNFKILYLNIRTGEVTS